MRNAGKRKGALHVALALSLLLGSAAFTAAQDPSKSFCSAPTQMERKPTNCEFHIATLDAAHNQAGKEGLVIAIARLGDGEQRPELNRRRLHNVRAYLVEFDHRSP